MSEEYLRQLKRINQQTDSLLQGVLQGEKFNMETLLKLQMETEKLCELNKKNKKNN